MSRTDDPSQTFTWNIAKLANAFGLHRDTVTARLHKYGVEPVATSGRSLLYDFREAAEAIFRDVVLASAEPEDMDPANRRSWFQSENERLKFETDQGQLIPDHEVAMRMSVVTKRVANFLDSLPDAIERECGATPDQLQAVERTLDQVRERIYREAAK